MTAPEGRPPRRTGRRAGRSGTRDAILVAAREQFASRGYDGATIRAIAAAAVVDPALVHHYYGTKERLFVAAMQLPIVPSEVISAALTSHTPGSAESVGQLIVRTALSTWESNEMRGTFQGLLRSAVTSQQAADMLREFLLGAILAPLTTAAAKGGFTAEIPLRASLIGSQMLGLAVARYVLQLPPIASATAAELAAAVGPTIDRYLTGDLSTAS